MLSYKNFLVILFSVKLCQVSSNVFCTFVSYTTIYRFVAMAIQYSITEDIVLPLSHFFLPVHVKFRYDFCKIITEYIYFTAT